MNNRLVFSSTTVDDSVLYSGVSYKQIVNSDTNYTVGNVACASISFTSEVINLTYINQSCTYYVKQSCDSDYRLVGTFKVLDVTKSKNRYTVTAYDNICKFDTNVSAFMSSLSYPITVGNLFGQLCSHCGCTAYSTTFLNSDFEIEANDTKEDITGRQVLAYIAEVGAGFVKCREDGTVQMADYVDHVATRLSTPTLSRSDTQLTITASDNSIGFEMVITDGNETYTKYITTSGTESSSPIVGTGISSAYYTSFDYQDYYTPTIDYVHVGKSANDQGVRKGDTLDNALEILNNPLLTITSTNESEVQTVCNNIYNRVHQVTYQPLEVDMLADHGFNAGEISFVDGKKAYIMEKTWTASGVSLKSNGSSTRESGEVATAEERSGAETEALQEDIDDLWDTTDSLQTDIDDLQTDIDDLQTDIEEIQNDYLVSASVSGDTLTITDNHGVSITFTGGGGYFG